MRTPLPRLACVVALAGIALACDQKTDTADLEAKKTKSVFDVKQSAKNDMSKEELEEARRKAGFKSHEERLEEAKAEYDKMEKGFIKARLAGYRDLMKAVKAELDEVGKAAPKWGGADPAFEKWNGKYKENVKAVKKKHSELTENGARGGNVEVEINALLTDWDAFNAELNAKTPEADITSALDGMKGKIAEIEKQLDDIEKDDTIVPEESEEKGEDEKGDKKKGKKKDDTKE